MAMLFITHDDVVRRIADEVTVMRHGRIVEFAPMTVFAALPIPIPGP